MAEGALSYAFIPLSEILKASYRKKIIFSCGSNDESEVN